MYYYSTPGKDCNLSRNEIFISLQEFKIMPVYQVDLDVGPGGGTNVNEQ